MRLIIMFQYTEEQFGDQAERFGLTELTYRKEVER